MDMEKRAERMRQWVRDRGWDDEHRKKRIDSAMKAYSDKQAAKLEAKRASAREYEKRRYYSDPEHRKRKNAKSSEWSRTYGDRNNERRRERYRTDPEYRQRRIEYAADWARRNRNVLNERQRERYHADPEFRRKRIVSMTEYRRRKKSQA